MTCRPSTTSCWSVTAYTYTPHCHCIHLVTHIVTESLSPGAADRGWRYHVTCRRHSSPCLRRFCLTLPALCGVHRTRRTACWTRASSRPSAPSSARRRPFRRGRRPSSAPRGRSPSSSSRRSSSTTPSRCVHTFSSPPHSMYKAQHMPSLLTQSRMNGRCLFVPWLDH